MPLEKLSLGKSRDSNLGFCPSNTTDSLAKTLMFPALPFPNALACKRPPLTNSNDPTANTMSPAFPCPSELTEAIAPLCKDNPFPVFILIVPLSPLPPSRIRL